MESTDNHTISFIRTFIVKEKQERLLALLHNKKKRIQFRLLLAHHIELNKSKVIPIKKEEYSKNFIYKTLKEKGSPDRCYIICESSTYDNREMDLKDAINELYCMDLGFIISCIPGKLAYYQGEDALNKSILVN